MERLSITAYREHAKRYFITLKLFLLYPVINLLKSLQTLAWLLMKKNLHLQSTPAGILVLMYHRVEKVDSNPWGICVSPQNFAKQIRFLKEKFNVISIDELVAAIVSGKFSHNSVCITFDDGYADNYIHAKPILEKYNCAATFFIATAFINKTKSFWWDELEMIFLQSKKLPAELNLPALLQ